MQKVHVPAPLFIYNVNKKRITMEKEIWKDIPGYEGYYQVSNLGRIKSLSRVVKRGIKGDMSIKERILKQPLTPEGYNMVGLIMFNKRKTYLVHRLVAASFIENPENKRTVNHIDCDKTNNNVLNLEWATYSENIKHAEINNLMNRRYGHKHHSSKLTKNQVLEIRNSDKELEFFSEKFNVSISTIYKARRGETYNNIK